MAERTLNEIEAEIAATKAELENVHGTETEVYARIVGYYRAVKNWNKGKRDEFDHRKMFVYDSPFSKENNETAVKVENNEVKSEKKNIQYSEGEPASYEFFMRQTCPNCPPVKNFMSNVSIEGKMVDVDTEDGLKLAAKNGVFAAPTVIVYDVNGVEIGRGHNVDELSVLLGTVVLAQAC